MNIIVVTDCLIKFSLIQLSIFLFIYILLFVYSCFVPLFIMFCQAVYEKTFLSGMKVGLFDFMLMSTFIGKGMELLDEFMGDGMMLMGFGDSDGEFTDMEHPDKG
jgi:hypothetical protein